MTQAELRESLADLDRLRSSRLAAAQAARIAAASASERAAKAEEAARDAAELASRRADFMREVEKVTEADLRFDKQTEATLATVGAVERHLVDISHRMEAGVGRERSILGDGQAAVARIQIAVAVSQLDIEARQIEMNASSRSDTYRQRVAALEAANIDHEQGCHAAHPVNLASPVPADLAGWNHDCLLLFDAARAFDGAKTESDKKVSELEQTIDAQQAVRRRLVSDLEYAE